MKRKIDEVIKNHPTEWKALFNYPEILNDIRQDRVLTSSSSSYGDEEKEEKEEKKSEELKENLVKYPVKPNYGEKELRDLELTNFYDTTCHLGNLTIVAHKINQRFHDAIRGIYEINPKTGVSKDDKIQYRSGPVKDITRCKAKTENETFSFFVLLAHRRFQLN